MQPKLSSAVAHDGGLKGTAQFGTLFRHPLHEIYSLSWHFLLCSLTAGGGGWWWCRGAALHSLHTPHRPRPATTRMNQYSIIEHL